MLGLGTIAVKRVKMLVPRELTELLQHMLKDSRNKWVYLR